MSRAKLVTVIPFLATMPLLSVQARAQCRINEAFELVGSNAPAGFGRSVAVDGDVAVVGESRIGTSGAAYVYRFDGTTWIEEAELLPSEGPEDARFGWSVDISDDVVVVGGAPISGDTFPVHVFRYNGLAWEEEAKLRGSDPRRKDAFGQSVSIDGDVLVVGAPGDDVTCSGTGGCNAGAAYVFRFGETGWQEEVKLFSSDLEAADNFGFAVSVSNDTLLVGTPSDITDGVVHGSAYIYWFDGDKWIGEVKFTASDASHAAHFGESVSIDGGVAVIGAPGSNDSSGAAYIYRFVGFIGWIEEAKLTAFDAAAGDEFGRSVALSGDTVLIGARFDDGDFDNSGSAHVYRHDGKAWNAEAKLTASNAEEGDVLGRSVALNGDLALIGAPGHDSVYFFGTKIVPSRPSCGGIDARQPSDPAGGVRESWKRIELAYESEPDELDIDDFSVTVSPPNNKLTITGINSDEGTVTIHFDAVYPDGTWTTITHVPSWTSTRIGYLPADVNADGTSNTSDILALIDSLNLAIDPPLPIWSTDIDRSGIAMPSDILRVIDLLNGAGSYASYIGQSLPE